MIVLVVVILIIVGGVLAVTMRDTEETSEEEGQLDVGFSIGDFSNPWRRQHMDVIESEMQAENIVGDYKITSAGSSATDQASDIRSLADLGMDLIIINPESSDALNPAIEYAHNQGATVVTTDQHVTSEYATNVIIDQERWFADQTEWLCEQLDGEGNIVVINGYPGVPANEARKDGTEKVLENYPDINVLETIEGRWQKDKVQNDYAAVIAEHGGDIDGVLAQDGMMQGVHWAYEEAGINYEDPEYPGVMTGDHTMRYLRTYWTDLKDAGIKNYMRANPPGYYAQSSLQVGLRLAQGENLDTTHEDVDTNTYPANTVWLPLGPAITNQNVDNFIEEFEFKPDGYRIDTRMTDEEAEEYFE